MSNDAIYFPNILQLAISLKYGDSVYFNKIDTYGFGNVPEHDNDYSLIGTEQALEFVNEIYNSKYLALFHFIVVVHVILQITRRYKDLTITVISIFTKS